MVAIFAAAVIAVTATIPVCLQTATSQRSWPVVASSKGTTHTASGTIVVFLVRRDHEQFFRSSDVGHHPQWIVGMFERHTDLLCPMVLEWAATLVSISTGPKFVCLPRKSHLLACELAYGLETISFVALGRCLAIAALEVCTQLFRVQDASELAWPTTAFGAFWWAMKHVHAFGGSRQPSLIGQLRVCVRCLRQSNGTVLLRACSWRLHGWPKELVRAALLQRLLLGQLLFSVEDVCLESTQSNALVYAERCLQVVQLALM